MPIKEDIYIFNARSDLCDLYNQISMIIEVTVLTLPLNLIIILRDSISSIINYDE